MGALPAGRLPAQGVPRHPLRIGEAARALGVKPPVLRLWEAHGLLRPHEAVRHAAVRPVPPRADPAVGPRPTARTPVHGGAPGPIPRGAPSTFRGVPLPGRRGPNRPVPHVFGTPSSRAPCVRAPRQALAGGAPRPHRPAPPHPYASPRPCVRAVPAARDTGSAPAPARTRGPQAAPAPPTPRRTGRRASARGRLRPPGRPSAERPGAPDQSSAATRSR
ncbi:MerR family DNA-binding transcriptional regulator [Streptomyces fradiae]|uniref:MerR family DNA-binding transcriptional regulator n=1 Tax=Streptomyces fradiae TaxID=1906 RepID=UPI0033D4A5DF